MKLEEVHRRAQEQPSKFLVILEDNFHYMDDDDRRVQKANFLPPPGT